MNIKYLSILLILLMGNALQSQDITEGVIAHWQLNDGEAPDLSDSDLEGDLFDPEETEDRFGNEDGALLFNGENDYIVFSDALDDVITQEDAQFSISMWYKTGDFLPALSPLICKYAHSLCGDTQRQWALLVEDGFGVRFYYAGTTDNLSYRSISTLDNPLADMQTWYHVVATYDGSVDSGDGQDRVQLFVNDVLQVDTLNFSIGDLPQSIPDGTAPIGLMGYVSVDGNQCGDFNAPGALDDIRIYNRLLLESEVNLLFIEGVDGIDEISDFSDLTEVSPNPIANNEIRWRVSQDLKLETGSLYSVSGKKVMDVNVNAQAGWNTIKVPNLSQGVYVLQLVSVNGQSSHKRIVIE